MIDPASFEVPAGAVQCVTRADWRAWLAENWPQPEGVWLVTFKRSAGDLYLPYEDAVEEALCFGWVDSKPRALDQHRTMLWFAPRKPGSLWSRPNKERVSRLIASGQMHASGMAKVEAAQKDGTWEALDAVEDLVIPPDLQTALANYPAAATHFDQFPRSARRGILEWILQAKTPATREKRVLETARLAEQNIRANQWKRP